MIPLSASRNASGMAGVCPMPARGLAIREGRRRIYDLRFTIYDTPHTTHDLRRAKGEGGFTIYDSRFTTHHTRHTIREGRRAKGDLRFTIYDLRHTTHDTRHTI